VQSDKGGIVRHGNVKRSIRLVPVLVVGVLIAAVVSAIGATGAGSAPSAPKAKFTTATAFDVSKPLTELVRAAPRGEAEVDEEDDELPEGAGPGSGHDADAAVQTAAAAAAIPAPLANFEGIRNEDNFTNLGGRVNPPDPVGDVGPNHYVEMVNLAFQVFSKSGTPLLSHPAFIGTLWDGFAVPECTGASGDPIVLYDQTTDRWILSQFTTAGLPEQNLQIYDCVAISTTGDPTGTYFRYAFPTQPDTVHGGFFFPDYPKYGVWSNSYVLTTRDFGSDPDNPEYGISVYALEKNKMVNGEANARAVQFFLDSRDVPLNLIGDGLLPPDMDGNRRPQPTDSPAPIVGTQDNGGPYGATSDALNIWELTVHWRSTPTASISDAQQLPVAPFDSNYPCNGEAFVARDCLPQPGITNTTQFLDILSYRQRPTYRLAYRNFGTYEALVTNQSVNAGTVANPQAGVRWYEIRRTNGTYSLYQQGTYAPNDGIHRWMGSVAMDKKGDIAAGYSVVNGANVFPGIRYTGRLAGDPLGQMTLSEGTIMDGTGVQTTTNSRWGDYTSMNVDPTDDCTFWYVNEYYKESGVPLPAPPPPNNDTRPWRTRIASFKLPGC
jgi:hypothetical protein